MFETLDSGRKRSWKSWIASAVIELAVVVILILVPLVYTDSLPTGILQANALSAPPLPPAGPKAIPTVPVPKGARPKPAPSKPNGFFEPTAIPKVIPRDFGPVGNPTTDPNVVGIPGGIPGGTGNGCVGCFGGPNGFPVPTAAPPPPPPPPPAPAPPVPPPPPPPPAQVTRIGGDVAQANLISQVKPSYPPLARAARVQGIVLLQATISKEGKIEDLRIISGNPLLNDAAIEAVKQWRYKPQMLNGQPIEVITTITVNFSFAQ